MSSDPDTMILPSVAAARRRAGRYAADATLQLAARVVMDQMREELNILEYEIGKKRLRLKHLEAKVAATKEAITNAK